VRDIRVNFRTRSNKRLTTQAITCVPLTAVQRSPEEPDWHDGTARTRVGVAFAVPGARRG